MDKLKKEIRALEELKRVGAMGVLRFHVEVLVMMMAKGG